MGGKWIEKNQNKHKQANERPTNDNNNMYYINSNNNTFIEDINTQLRSLDKQEAKKNCYSLDKWRWRFSGTVKKKNKNRMMTTTTTTTNDSTVENEWMKKVTIFISLAQRSSLNPYNSGLRATLYISTRYENEMMRTKHSCSMDSRTRTSLMHKFCRLAKNTKRTRE